MKMNFLSKVHMIHMLEMHMNNIMNHWTTSSSTGGKMRCERGEDIERFVIFSIDTIRNYYDVPLFARRGSSDLKLMEIQYPSTPSPDIDSESATAPEPKTIIKHHQVDVHVYFKDQFVCAIECKAYLDSCFYTRACEDFSLFRRFNYNVKCIVFALENSIDSDTKLFIDYTKDYVCDDVFYILDGKRSSTKPIYNKKYAKPIHHIKFVNYINFILQLANKGAEVRKTPERADIDAKHRWTLGTTMISSLSSNHDNDNNNIDKKPRRKRLRS